MDRQNAVVVRFFYVKFTCRGTKSVDNVRVKKQARFKQCTERATYAGQNPKTRKPAKEKKKTRTRRINNGIAVADTKN